MVIQREIGAEKGNVKKGGKAKIDGEKEGNKKGLEEEEETRFQQ